MKKLLIYTALLIMAVMFVFLQSCNRKTPQITYIDNIVTQHDTTYATTYTLDTIYSSVPCDSFTRVITNNDTVYIRTVKKVKENIYIVKKDTVYRTPIIVNNGKTKIDNSVKTKAKGGSAIGDGNKIDNSKTVQFWLGVFVACATLYGIAIGLNVLSSFFPAVKPFSFIVKKLLPGGI